MDNEKEEKAGKYNLNIKIGDWFIADIIGKGIYEMVDYGTNSASMKYAIVKLKKLFIKGSSYSGHETTCHPIDPDKWNLFKIVKRSTTPAPLSEQKQEGETHKDVCIRAIKATYPTISNLDKFAERYFVTHMEYSHVDQKLTSMIIEQSQHTAKQIEERDVEAISLAEAERRYFSYDGKMTDEIVLKRTIFTTACIWWNAVNNYTPNDHQEALLVIGKQWTEKRELLKQIDQYKARTGQLEAALRELWPLSTNAFGELSIDEVNADYMLYQLSKAIDKAKELLHPTR